MVTSTTTPSRDRLLSPIHRDDLSRPVRLALETGILNEDTTFFDYAKGEGGDIQPADIVNLSYALNVIKSSHERQKTLQLAWKLTQQVLIVAEQIIIDDRESGQVVYGDGIVIPCNTGEKYFQQQKLKTYIDGVLKVDAVPVGLGVYFVFRDEARAERFRVERFRSRITTPSVCTSIELFENNRELLAPLMAFLSDRGRLPVKGELATEPELIAKFRSIRRAFEVILQATDPQDWDAITEKCRQDFLVYLACRRYPGETRLIPSLQDLPPEIQNDISALFESYQQACEIADEMLSSLGDANVFANCCQNSEIGKKLPGALYVHVSAIAHLNPLLRIYEGIASRNIGGIDRANIVKFHTKKPKISYLLYPDFDTDPHPALHASIQIDIQDQRLGYRNYNASDNPPILHRKETFVAPDYPQYEIFAQLTRQEEALGLLDKTRAIGTREVWLRCLEDDGLEIQGHRVVRLVEGAIAIEENTESSSLVPKIDRHKAAIFRTELSRPMRLALEAGLFTQDTTFFDYGCGHGGDVERMTERGYTSAGWDPYYCPDNPRIPADIVNIGYVINAIENLDERREALLKAWELTGKVSIVAAQVLINDENSGQVAYGDGIITSRNTFQKYYDQQELKTYIDGVLGVDAIAAALGIYFVFRDEAQAESFRASRFRSRATTPRVRTPSKRFEDYQELLQPLMAFVTERGRLPVKGELANEAELLGEFGYFRRAFRVILQATDKGEWEAIAHRRRQDTLVYLALKQVSLGEDRSIAYPRYHTPTIQNDIKGLFGTYQQVCNTAAEMLYSVGNLSAIAELCQNSKIGQQLPNALCVHVCALEQLDPLLRIYEGTVSQIFGRMDGANLIKFHTDKLKISYLFYPDFDTDPHPALHTSMHIDLRTRQVSYQEFETSNDPPILHCKDACVTPDYPLYEKFAKLTRQEENWGLLDDFRTIRTRKGWLKCLKEHCAEIRGHQVFWCKDADPYRVKYLRSARRARLKMKNGQLKMENDE